MEYSHNTCMEYEMTEAEVLSSLYCDLHKDVYGVKARWYRVDNTTESLAQARLDIEALQVAGEAIWAEEKAQEERMVIDLEALIDQIKAMGAKTREDALRWLHDAYQTQGDDDYLCYHLGVPYGYFRK